MDRILAVCTANQCRSPTAAALLARACERLGIDVAVGSAGVLGEGGHQVPPPLERIARARGIDLSSHRSRGVAVEDLTGAQLVLGMAREHVRALVVMEPSSWPKVFTLREFVRRSSIVGPRLVGQPLSEWLAVVHEGRATVDLMGESDLDDIADPMGGPDEGYERLLDELAVLCEEAVQFAWGGAGLRSPRD